MKVYHYRSPLFLQYYPDYIFWIIFPLESPDFDCFLTALVWNDRREVYMLTNMDPPPAEGNFCDNSNCPVKPHIMERYNRHVGFVDISDHMANSYLMDRRNLK